MLLKQYAGMQFLKRTHKSLASVLWPGFEGRWHRGRILADLMLQSKRPSWLSIHSPQSSNRCGFGLLRNRRDWEPALSRYYNAGWFLPLDAIVKNIWWPLWCSWFTFREAPRDLNWKQLKFPKIEGKFFFHSRAGSISFLELTKIDKIKKKIYINYSVLW